MLLKEANISFRASMPFSCRCDIGRSFTHKLFEFCLFKSMCNVLLLFLRSSRCLLLLLQELHNLCFSLNVHIFNDHRRRNNFSSECRVDVHHLLSLKILLCRRKQSLFHDGLIFGKDTREEIRRWLLTYKKSHLGCVPVVKSNLKESLS